MLTQEEAVEIRVLARRGVGLREIARQMGCSRNTVRRYLRDAEADGYKPRASRATKLDAFKDYLTGRVEAARPDWIPAPVLMHEIRERGYRGGITQIKAYLATLKPTVACEPVRRFETAPGLQMQADFTFIRRGSDPLMALVATMGYSRAAFVRFSQKEDESALAEALRAAFDYFGGVPAHVLFDNAKTVVLQRDAYGPGLHRWNPELIRLADECGFAPRLCRPDRAKTKGQVERFNRYLKGSFLVPLTARMKADGLRLDVATANAAVMRWLEEVANARVHATTGAIPAIRLAEEQLVMLPPPRLVSRPAIPVRRVIPVESLQHPLSVYDELLEVAA
ncbi:MAG: IS21 family transposase [Pseudomonadota bacterium]